MMYTDPKPFPRSYWVVPGKLLAGEYPGHRNPTDALKKMEKLVSAGIRTIINLQEEHETDYYGNIFAPYGKIFHESTARAGATGFTYRCPIIDNDIPDPDDMIKILDTIDQSIAENKPVYIHCWGGKGRTGTVVGCYLIRHGIAEAANALDYLKRLRLHDAHADEPSPQTHDQRDFVRNWKKGL